MIDSILVPILTLAVPPLPSSTFNKLEGNIKNSSVSSTFYDPKTKTESTGLVYLDMDPPLLHSELNVYSNILGVIGIIHCSDSNDLNLGLERFSQMLGNYSKCLASLVLAYDANDSIKDWNQSKDASKIVLVSSNYSCQYADILSRLVSEICSNLGKMMLDLEKSTVIASPLNPSTTTGQKIVTSPSSLSLPTAAHVSKEGEGSSPVAGLGFGQFFNSDKRSAKRTAGRMVKLHADIYALAGKWDLAIASYNSCIETMKGNSDYLWHASALEGLIGCQLGDLYKRYLRNLQILEISNGKIIQQSRQNTDLKVFIQELPEKFRDIVYLYGKSDASPIYGIKASLKISKFLAEMVSSNLDLNNSGILSGGGYFVAERNLASEIASGLSRTAEKIYSPLSLQDISSWIMKIWNDLSGIPAVDQICTLGEITTILGRIGFHRKQSFFLYHLVKEISALNIPNSSKSLLDCMDSLCKILGVDSAQLEMGEWLDEFQNEDDLSSQVGSHTKDATHRRNRYGWPRLQILALQECIDISERDGDHKNSIIYLIRLLRQLHKYLSKQEQSRLCERLQTILVRSEESASDDSGGLTGPTANSQGKQVKLETGVPLLRKIMPIIQAARKVPIKHPLDDWDLETAGHSKPKKVFIYNPYDKTSKKEKEEVILIVGEVAYFDMTLANPFSFELDIQSISLNTTGIAFQSIPADIIIPASTRAHTIRLSGIPLEVGKLNINGCHIRMLGGCIEEDIVHISELLRPFRSKDGKYRKQSPKERIFGRNQLEFIGKGPKLKENTSATNNKTVEGLSYDSIEKQPFLQIVDNSSAESQVSLFLIEGERMTHNIQIENTSDVAIDFLNIAFVEDSLDDEESKIISPEGIYERDVFNYSLRSFWLEKVFSDDNIFLEPSYNFFADSAPILLPKVERVLISLRPKERITIQVGIFGKKECTTGSLVLDYGRKNNTSVESSFFYTRQLRVSFDLTVQAVLQAKNIDFVNHQPETDDRHGSPSRGFSDQELLFDPYMTELRNGPTVDDLSNEQCFMTFDIQNSSSLSFEIVWKTFEDDTTMVAKNSYVSSLRSKMSKRYILPFTPFLLQPSYFNRAIPTPSWRQFVVGKLKKNSEQEEAHRRLIFWYKEALIGGLETRGRILGYWSTSKGRKGIILLRNIQISPQMLMILKKPEIFVSANICSQSMVRKESPMVFSCPLNEIIKFNIQICNNRESSVKLSIRILLVQTNGTDYTPADSDSIFLHGPSTYVTPIIAPNDTHLQSFSFICVSQGRYGLVHEVGEVAARSSTSPTHCHAILEQTVKKILYIIANGKLKSSQQ